MYVPDPFALHDQAAIAGLLQRHSFALLVTAADGAPQASHLPFLYDPGRGPKGTLVAHLARANPQRRELERLAAEGGQALVVFQGPHAYVSPRWYGTSQAVPTWNYLAVHAYGRPEIVAEPERVRAIIERLIATHESGLAEPWSLDSQKQTYVSAMLRGIVAFEIPVARLDATAKLNQNKPAEARLAAAAALRESGGAQAQEVAALMESPVIDP
jgi:transcriptional regulator